MGSKALFPLRILVHRIFGLPPSFEDGSRRPPLHRYTSLQLYVLLVVGARYF